MNYNLFFIFLFYFFFQGNYSLF